MAILKPQRQRQRRSARGLVGIVAFLHATRSAVALAPPNNPLGSAATPITKKGVAVLGGGGYLGAVTFGFLQRAASLYGTGIGRVRCLGATADTSIRLNRFLSKQFQLAFADESLVKLTDLHGSVDDTRRRLEGWDALILGNDLSVTLRPCTANTFERTPNDKTWEVYWDRIPSIDGTDSKASLEQKDAVQARILDNLLAAAAAADVRHIVGVDDPHCAPELALGPRLVACGIPYTRLVPVGRLISVPDYTYRRGLVGQLLVEPLAEGSDTVANGDYADLQLAREDVGALAVQALQSLDWITSRSLRVSCAGPLEVTERGTKRPDQEWCVQSRQLARALEGVL